MRDTLAYANLSHLSLTHSQSLFPQGSKFRWAPQLRDECE